MAAIYNLFQASFFINFDRRLANNGRQVDSVDVKARFPNGGSFGSHVLATGVVSRRVLTPTPSASVSLSRSPSLMLPCPLPFLFKTHDWCGRSIELPSNRKYPLRRRSIRFPFVHDVCDTKSKTKISHWIAPQSFSIIFIRISTVYLNI